MIPKQTVVALTLVALLAAPLAMALELGDAAPPLKIKKWIKGKPVDLKAAQGKHVIVLEFWATWCGPCRASIPHLTELQKKYKDKGLVVVGISSGEKLETVEKFVSRQGDRMDYTVAWDDDRATSNIYMGGFKKRGIPQAFLIDKQGKIVWEGHPQFGLDEVVEKVLSGDYTIKSLAEVTERLLRQEQEKQELLTKYFQLVSQENADEQAAELGKKLYEVIKDDAHLLNMLSWMVLTEKSVRTRDLDLALRAARRANELTKGEDPSILDTYARALWDTGQKQEAVKLQKKAVDQADSEQLKAQLAKTLRRYEQEL